MKRKMFDAKEYKDIKQIIYAACEKYSDNVAFVIKHKEEKDVTYENITYSQLFKDINKLGTALYNIGMKNKRVAIVGKNRYEWVLVHLANLLRRNSFSST